MPKIGKGGRLSGKEPPNSARVGSGEGEPREGVATQGARGGVGGIEGVPVVSSVNAGIADAGGVVGGEGDVPATSGDATAKTTAAVETEQEVGSGKGQGGVKRAVVTATRLWSSLRGEGRGRGHRGYDRAWETGGGTGWCEGWRGHS